MLIGIAVLSDVPTCLGADQPPQWNFLCMTSVKISDLPKHCDGINREAVQALEDLALKLGSAAFEVGKALLLLPAPLRLAVSSRSASSLMADFNDSVFLPEAGFARATHHNGTELKGQQKLFEVPGCDARFKVVSNGAAGSVRLATNAGRHLKGAYLVAYHRVLEVRDLRKARAGIDGLWLLHVSKVGDRKASKRGAFAGNVGSLEFSEEFRLAIPAGAQVRRLTA